MDTQHIEHFARLTPALHDTGCAYGVGADRGALRAEAQRQLRWQQRALARTVTPHMRGTTHLVVPAARAGLAYSSDLPRQAGEDVPSWFDQGRLLSWTTVAARRSGYVRLADLSADITRVLARFDSVPLPLGAGVTYERPREVRIPPLLVTI